MSLRKKRLPIINQIAMKLRPISLILPFVLFAVSSSLGQLIGSSENGQSTPKEVKSSEITSGGISADVNLFTGTLNASYSLGTVSTPTGLRACLGIL